MRSKSISGLLFFILFALVSCKTKPEYATVYIDFPVHQELKAITIELDTALFRYPYRMRVHGDKIIVMDLHNADYYFHLFQYPDFQYLSSFGKRGGAPEEMLSAENTRIVNDEVWVLDANKGKITQLNYAASGDSLLETDAVTLDKELLRCLDFCMLEDTIMLIPDYSGENRVCVVGASGRLLNKMGAIPTSNHSALQESKPALAQAWRSFIDYHPGNGTLVGATQLGEVLEIYNVNDKTHHVIMGPNGEPEFQEMNGYAVPSGIMGFCDIQVTDNYIYAVFQGRTFKDIMKQRDAIIDGGQYIYVFDLKGNPVRKYTLDRYIHGIYVDEAANRILATDVNNDQPLIYFSL